MACLPEQAYAAGEITSEGEDDVHLPHDLIDALAVDSDPRVRRLRELLRPCGWSGWNRMQRLAEPPDGPVPLSGHVEPGDAWSP